MFHFTCSLTKPRLSSQSSAFFAIVLFVKWMRFASWFMFQQQNYNPGHFNAMATAIAIAMAICGWFDTRNRWFAFFSRLSRRSALCSLSFDDSLRFRDFCSQLQPNHSLEIFSFYGFFSGNIKIYDQVDGGIAALCALQINDGLF